MKLDEIKAFWDVDSKIDSSELGVESLRTPEVHNKYFKYMLSEGQVLRSLDAQYKRLYRLKWEYYLGLLDQDTLKKQGWEPWSLKILRGDVGIYLDSDEEMQALKEKLDFQKEKFNFIEQILKVVHNRGFAIKSAIDWIKFQNGQ